MIPWSQPDSLLGACEKREQTKAIDVNEAVPTFDVLSVLSLVGIGQGMFLCLLLLVRSDEKSVAHRILAAFLVVIVLGLLDQLLYYTKYSLLFPHFVFFGAPLSITLGPLIYIFARACTEQSFALRLRHLSHFIPVLFTVALFLFLYHLHSAEYKVAYLVEEYKRNASSERYSIQQEAIAINSLAFVYTLVYIFAALQIFRRYARRPGRVQPTNHKPALYFLFGFLALVGINIVIFALSIYGYNPHDGAWQFVNLLLSVNIFVLAYFVLSEPQLVRRLTPRFPETEIHKIRVDYRSGSSLPPYDNRSFGNRAGIRGQLDNVTEAGQETVTFNQSFVAGHQRAIGSELQ